MKAVKKDIFDINKVTVVGSPTITSDGVASGFSSSNYIYGLIDIALGKKIVIEQRFNTLNATSDLGVLGVYTGSTYTSLSSNFNFGLDVSGSSKLFLRYYNGSSSTNYNTNLTITANTEYNIRIEYNGVSELKLYVNNTLIATISNYSPLGVTSFVKPGAYVSYLSSGSIDLKQFKIYVDGELVYSPTRPITFLERRKEGFDLSKFTVVGSPTITEDGVASGFSSENYLQTNIFDFSIASSWCINFKFTTPTDTSTLGYNRNIFGRESFLRVALKTDRKITLLMAGSNIQWADHPSSSLLNLGTTYFGKAYFTGNSYKLDLSTDGIIYENYVTYNNSNVIYSTYLGIGYHFSGGDNYAWAGSIDLSQFSITVDGKEVFTGAKEKFYAIGD